jgi:hypothetical protein
VYQGKFSLLKLPKKAVSYQQRTPFAGCLTQVSESIEIRMLRLSHQLLSKYPDVMLLADRGFANHQVDELA